MAISPEAIQQTKPRFYRQLPNFGFNTQNRTEVPQAMFLSELDPNGHAINDRMYYKDIEKEQPILDEDGKDTGKKRIITVPIERVATAMQFVILEKQTTHICGDKLKFINHNLKPSEADQNLFIQFKQGWEKKNMETAKYEFVRSIKATGDAAFCASLDKGKFSYRVFSITNGDKMHPVYDDKGKLRIFGREYTAYDYTKQEDVPRMEVWDDEYVTVLSYDTEYNKSKGSIAWNDVDFKHRYVDSGEFDGWQVYQEPVKHGFTRMPVVYLKDEMGACWSPAQDLIDKLDLALSQLFENNKHYAFRIMVVKGDVAIQGDLQGQARAMMFDDKEGDAKFMEKADASESFKLQLEETVKHIQLASFTVFNTDNITGDVSGVALKIRYSPAIEKAINDKHFLNGSIDEIVELFKEGYGVEMKRTLDYKKLDLRGEIQIYIHQSDTETFNNVVLGVNSKTLSRETGSSVLPYAVADEMARLENQKKKDMEYELEMERYALLGKEKPIDDGMNDTNLERQILAKKEG